eukprot:Em0001g1473a
MAGLQLGAFTIRVDLAFISPALDCCVITGVNVLDDPQLLGGVFTDVQVNPVFTTAVLGSFPTNACRIEDMVDPWSLALEGVFMIGVDVWVDLAFTTAALDTSATTGLHLDLELVDPQPPAISSVIALDI